jgi:hypothetical protein
MEANSSARERKVIIESWDDAERPPVDARLLDGIGARLERELGRDYRMSPAAIARVLADEGAELKHPEIIEADTEWREATVKASCYQSKLELLRPIDVMTLSTAEAFIVRLEDCRHQSEGDNETAGRLRSIASEARRLAEAIARNRAAEQAIRDEQAEIAEWLKLWLQTPALFKNWLELRKATDEFRASFPRA